MEKFRRVCRKLPEGNNAFPLRFSKTFESAALTIELRGLIKEVDAVIIDARAKRRQEDAGVRPCDLERISIA